MDNLVKNTIHCQGWNSNFKKGIGLCMDAGSRFAEEATATP